MEKYRIIGAIIGDIVGSVFERNNVKSTDFPLFSDESDFTDDTVLTVAVADCIINKKDYTQTIQTYAQNYYGRGYGGSFINWIALSDPKPYNSWGNGSAMRVSPVGFAYNSLKEVLENAKKSAEVTHNHPEGIKGAQTVASAIFLARTGKSKEEIKKYISETFSYDLSKSLDEIRTDYKFDVSCQGSVPQAITAFLESSDFENSVRLAISIGGDSDTIACMTGSISAAYYKHIKKSIVDKALELLPKDFIKIIDDFDEFVK